MILLKRKKKIVKYPGIIEKIRRELALNLQNTGLSFTKVVIDMDEYYVNIRLNMVEDFFDSGYSGVGKR